MEGEQRRFSDAVGRWCVSGSRGVGRSLHVPRVMTAAFVERRFSVYHANRQYRVCGATPRRRALHVVEVASMTAALVLSLLGLYIVLAWRT